MARPPAHSLLRLQAQWDEEAAASHVVRRARQSGAIGATTPLALLTVMAITLGLLLPALVAACTRIPA